MAVIMMVPSCVRERVPLVKPTPDWRGIALVVVRVAIWTNNRGPLRF